MSSVGDLNHKYYFMEIKSICDFPNIDDFFFIQVFDKLFIEYLSCDRHNSRH